MNPKVILYPENVTITLTTETSLYKSLTMEKLIKNVYDQSA